MNPSMTSLFCFLICVQNFELTKHRLIYEGALTWRTKGQKNVDLHVVLLEEYILLLQKQDDKYVLKFHSINYLNSKEESKCTHSPIIKIATVLVRPVATGEIIFSIYISFLVRMGQGDSVSNGDAKGENMIVLLFGSINSNSTTLQTNWLCIWSTRRQRELRFMILWPSPSPRGKRKSELFPIPFGEMSWSLYSTRSLVVCPGIEIAY